MDRVGRQESRAQLNGFASAARAIKAALRSLSPPSSPRTPRTVSGGYVNSDSGKGGGASSPSPLTPRSAASVQHYCQACKVKPVVSGSKNPVHCSGQYPFQCCCVCAVEAGWKGWDHHACFQCKAEIGINVEPVTPEKEEVKAAASTESLPHVDSCKIMSPRHTMCYYTMPSMVTHVITSHRGNAANTVVASEKSNEPPASPRAHANRGIDREATSGNSLSILVSDVTVPVMSHATATRSSLRIALDATSLANSDDNSLQVQGLSPEAESQQDLEVHEAIEQEAVSTQQTQKILPELKWQYQTSPWTMTPSVVTWNSYGCGLGGSPKQVRVPYKWSSTAKIGKGPRILFSQAEEALQELQLQLQAKKRELDCLRIKHALDLKAERRENLGVHLATLKVCMFWISSVTQRPLFCPCVPVCLFRATIPWHGESV